MHSIRRSLVKPLLSVSIGFASIGATTSIGFADDVELALRGLVDCGKKVETSCNVKDSFFFWTDGYSEGTSRIKVDITWIKPDRVPQIDQEDELCLTGFVREDQVYQATSINEQCDEGTVNDKEQEKEKKDNRKERNKD
ncbi:MAG: hypothetical protein ACKVVP_11870 [Chloroflexota bacterium]